MFNKEIRVMNSYANATYNPDSAMFQKQLRQASQTILEIGCGIEPRVSWKIEPRQLWVGCDHQVKPEYIDKTNPSLIHVRMMSSKQIQSDQMVVFDKKVAEIPKFHPDTFLLVAPNQEDLKDGNILNDELEPFLSPTKNQGFVIVLDTRTREASGYQQEAIDKINKWMHKNKFFPENNYDIPDEFRPNSADLGGLNICKYFVRYSEE